MYTLPARLILFFWNNFPQGQTDRHNKSRSGTRSDVMEVFLGPPSFYGHVEVSGSELLKEHKGRPIDVQLLSCL